MGRGCGHPPGELRVRTWGKEGTKWEGTKKKTGGFPYKRSENLSKKRTSRKMENICVEGKRGGEGCEETNWGKKEGKKKKVDPKSSTRGKEKEEKT